MLRLTDGVKRHMNANSKVCTAWLLMIVAFGFTPKKTGAQSPSGDTGPSVATPKQDAKNSESHTPKPVGPPLQVFTPAEPWAFEADGRWHLVYELQVTNLGTWDCLLTRVDAVIGDSSGKPIASY